VRPEDGFARDRAGRFDLHRSARLPLDRFAVSASLATAKPAAGNGMRALRLLLPLQASLLLAAAPAARAAPDIVLLQQAIEPTKAGGVLLQIDRNRIATIVVDKSAGAEHVVSITMDRDQKPRFVLRCADLASARLVLDSLRADGPPSLDLTGRCRF